MAFDYTNYSYDELVQEVTRLVSNKDEWKDAYQSSTGQVLIQVVAAITDQLHYMLERRSQENFLPTARLQTSVNAIVNSLGYRPHRKVSATGTLSLTLVDDNGIPVQNTDTIIIPKYSKITFDGVDYVTNETITLLATQSYPYTFNVKEGIVTTSTYDTSDVTSSIYLSNYIDIVDYLDIENTSFFIYTSTQTFVDVTDRVGTDAPIDSLSFASATDEVYDINLTNVGLRLLFGDGTSGEKPTGTLTVEYITSSGASVEVLSTGNDFIFDDFKTELVDASAATYTYTLTNTTVVGNGLDEETISEIKVNAPTYVRTANRAASKDDYIFWIKQANIGGIVDVKAYGEEEIGINVINANNVYIIYLTSNGLPLSSINLALLDGYVDNYKIVTAQTIYEAATVIPLQISMKIKRSPLLTASNSEVYDITRNELINYFSFDSDNGDVLDKDINHSELVDHFHDFTVVKSGVTRAIADYINITIKALHAFATPWESVNPIDVTITYGSNGDTYTILLNDIPYTYVAQAGDTADDVAAKLYQLTSLDANTVPSVTTNVVTFDRNNATAENALLYSEDFNNAAWVTSGTIVVTPDAVAAPNGLTVATTLNDTDGAATSGITQSITVAADTNNRTLSVYVEKDAITTRFPAIYIRYSGGSAVESYVSLNTQTGATSIISGAAPTIVVDDYVDYWRVSLTLQNDSTNTLLDLGIFPAYSSTLGGAASVATTGSINVFGAQIEEKGSVGKYQRTTIKPVLRIYAENAIENRLLFNEELDDAVWVKSGVTITADSLNDSDGYATVDTVTYTGAAAGETVSQIVANVHSGDTYTFSWRAQQGTLSSSAFGVYDVTNSVWIIDPATNVATLTGTLDLFQTAFTVPATCTSVRLHPAWNDNTAGTSYVGQSQLRHTEHSSDYIQSHEKQAFYYDEGFFITNTGTTTVGNALINIPIQLPLSVLNNTENADLFYPTSIEIMQTDGTVIATDNGAGVIYGGTVDYKTGLITVPILIDGDYYIRYQQNIDQNYTANEKQAFTYSLPKTNYTDATELLSTIEINN